MVTVGVSLVTYLQCLCGITIEIGISLQLVNPLTATGRPFPD